MQKIRKYLLIFSKLIILSALLYLTAINFQKYYDSQHEEIKFLNESDKSFAYISGAINNPGVYEISNKTKLIDLVNTAGSFKSNADIEYISKNINLAKLVTNEEQFYIPFQE